MVDVSGSTQLKSKATGRRVRISVFGDNAGTGRSGQRKIGRRTVEGKKFNRRNKKKELEAKRKREAEEEARRNPAIKPPDKEKSSGGLNIFGTEDDAGDDGGDGGGDGGDDGGDGDGDDGGAGDS